MVSPSRGTVVRMFLVSCSEEYGKVRGYTESDQLLGAAFSRNRSNIALKDVLLKVSLLNSLYRTNIYNTFEMIEHILRIELDSALKSGSPQAVELLRRGHGIKRGDTELDLYSFATKYCHWHQPGLYPIYDSWVDESLAWLACELNIRGKLRGGPLRDFTLLKDMIDETKRALELPWKGYKKVDEALWIAGKAMWKNGFPRLSAAFDQLEPSAQCVPRKLKREEGKGG